MIFLHPVSLLLFISPQAAEEKIFPCTGRLKKPNITKGTRNLILGIRHDLTRIEIPEKFDAREQWSQCPSIREIYDQGKCGGCWAFATSSVMADRLCIATNGKFKDHVSTQDLLECCFICTEQESGGCNGGSSIKAYEHWTTTGVVTGNKRCKPTDLRTIIRGFLLPECRKFCTKKTHKLSYNESKTFAFKYIVEEEPLKNIEHIQAEIMLNGPVSATLEFYEILHKVNRNSVLYFNPATAGEIGPVHAIKIIGWDVIEEVPVWIIANSFGKRWGTDGFAYIRRGHNDFNIEEFMAAGIVKRVKSNNKIRERTTHSRTKPRKRFGVIATLTVVLQIVVFF